MKAANLLLLSGIGFIGYKYLTASKNKAIAYPVPDYGFPTVISKPITKPFISKFPELNPLFSKSNNVKTDNIKTTGLVSPPYKLPDIRTLPMVDLSRWEPPKSASPYIAIISTVERQHNMPKNLLARLLYQESRFRPEIINGQLKSPAGAMGIAQVMPLTAKGPGYGTPPLKNPYDPFEAIPWAGQYLAGLYKSSGDWHKALAGYNWGLGNVNKSFKKYGTDWLKHAPTETKNYVVQISRDVSGVDNAIV